MTREEDNFKLTHDTAQGRDHSKSMMILLCSPSKPTGSMYSAEELGALADVASSTIFGLGR